MPAPINDATFCEAPHRSTCRRYSDSLVQLTLASGPGPPSSSALSRGVSGPIEVPSPNTSVVTPWVSSPSDRESCRILTSEWLRMLMKPGHTALPAASQRPPPRAATPADRRHPVTANAHIGWHRPTPVPS